jgi:hypothetical protein
MILNGTTQITGESVFRGSWFDGPTCLCRKVTISSGNNQISFINVMSTKVQPGIHGDDNEGFKGSQVGFHVGTAIIKRFFVSFRSVYSVLITGTLSVMIISN